MTEKNIDQKEKRDDKNKRVLYSVKDVPPWHITLILGFQSFLTCLGGTFSYPLIIQSSLCLSTDAVGLAQIIGTTIFVSGLSTLIQTIFGIRLPIVQSCSFAFVTPVISLLTLSRWSDCPFNNESLNQTLLPEIGGAVHRELWQARVREVNGAIMLASIFQVVIGLSGVLGLMMNFIGPLTVAPTIAMIGLSIFEVAYHKSENQWWIAVMTVALIVIFSQYLRNISIPCVGYTKGSGFSKTKIPIFNLFPVLFAIVTAWVICVILTVTGALSDDPKGWGYAARTDTKLRVLDEADWFRFPYPGQWGTPTVSLAGVFGMLAGVFASMIESVGDYYACARLAGAPPPPGSAISRGIGTEGLACIIGGAIGSPGGTTSYSENIGAIGITKVGSRVVIQVGAVIMIILGCFTKFGALFVTLPDPIVGGMFIVMFGMVTGVGISNLQFVDLNSSRNLLVVGLPMVFSLCLPKWLETHQTAINTGDEIADQILTVLFGTSMFVAGALAFFLDNTIPGTLEERGILKWKQKVEGADTDDSSDLTIYDIPLIQKYLNSMTWPKYVPFLPNFTGDKVGSGGGCCGRKKSANITDAEIYVNNGFTDIEGGQKETNDKLNKKPETIM
ncbi:solute carrier family 23 member 1 [Patella vulgata]|uniref:solute carrier family 23 member 1 n=1 Tax=Patella vulgata TaxID=6465 RepID=UPI00217F8024|nr:solute carrier family 23 member 1 [Patella vulgata]XP_050409385.1 solute carrier family 23 member 1 [Patella vulgata]XP_050409386.1 solute carrier family 23 member 1 [Patella vulgata]